MRNFNLMSVAQKVDEWSYREIRNQNELFAQPMLVRVRTAMDDERHLADASSDRLLLSSRCTSGRKRTHQQFVKLIREQALRHADRVCGV